MGVVQAAKALKSLNLRPHAATGDPHSNRKRETPYEFQPHKVHAPF